MDWFEVMDIRAHIENGKVGHYQVTLKVGFRISGNRQSLSMVTRQPLEAQRCGTTHSDECCHW